MTQDRGRISALHRRDQASTLGAAMAANPVGEALRRSIRARALRLIETLRGDGRPGLMEVFLEEYGLSSREGLALMCLAEALLRVPDLDTIDDLVADKVVPTSWREHLGHSSSALVNAATRGLLLSRHILDDDHGPALLRLLHGGVRKLGKPAIRSTLKRAMQELGGQFVLGETIGEAMQRGQAGERDGYTYSYDMLGEAALTGADADSYFEAYRDAIESVSRRATGDDPRSNPGISIKLSALHPRYEVSQRQRVLTELVPRVRHLAELARAANMGLHIDAEEADRLELSLDIIERVFCAPELASWGGFGAVVQAYDKRATAVIEWLYALARRQGRGMMIRLVKGAYWDAEIKRAQADGVADFPVFTAKAATDVSYICCARSLLDKTDRIYPQFATHNAHTMAAVLELATERDSFEFQRLHGMGRPLHELVKQQEGTRCRIYAPVGVHRDLVAYLVRRLLENSANSSFVNQIVDLDMAAEQIAADPFETVERELATSALVVTPPADLFVPQRANSSGWDLSSSEQLQSLDAARNGFRERRWRWPPAPQHAAAPDTREIINPADPGDVVGSVEEATAQQVEAALQRAVDWSGAEAGVRAETLLRAADLYQEHCGELLALLCREAGKTLPDAIAELREAIDFLRYYAEQGRDRAGGSPQGLFTCISPWNFPLAIFTGQIAAALVTGNGVLAKPAESTPLTALCAAGLLHRAGVPAAVLQLLPGGGPTVGALLTASPRVDGVCFTGSTATARTIHRAMAAGLAPGAPLIAETGGINAMIVDSSALPEQAVSDIIASAFQSAGQRCSALRMLYLQDDISAVLLEMLSGAMQELRLGDPWQLSTDIGPIISASAKRDIEQYIERRRREDRVVFQAAAPEQGHFVAPALIEVGGIGELEREIFGPVLHVASFRAQELAGVVDDINASGYGLTFGLHSRLDSRAELIARRIDAGNLYVNRNQIGAVVGSQPFGGEGLSGTGPKAGGPLYLQRFLRAAAAPPRERTRGRGRGRVPTVTDRKVVQELLDRAPRAQRTARVTQEMPGPTGETNRWSAYPRGLVLCLGPTLANARRQAETARSQGCTCVLIAPQADGADSLDGVLAPQLLAGLDGFELVAYWADDELARAYRRALAARQGPIVPLVTGRNLADYCLLERHICTDTTATGGNAALLASLA